MTYENGYCQDPEDDMPEDFDPEVAGDETAWSDEEQEMFEHFRFGIDKGQAPMRVDKYLATHMEYTSRHRIQCAIRQDYVRVNGKVAKANCIIRPGDIVTFVMPYQRRGLEILPCTRHQQTGRYGRPPRTRAFLRHTCQRPGLPFRHQPGT